MRRLLKWKNKAVTFIKRVLMEAIRTVVGLSVDLINNAEGTLILLLGVVGTIALIREIPFLVSWRPAFIDSGIMVTALALTIVPVLLWLANMRLQYGWFAPLPAFAKEEQ